MKNWLHEIKTIMEQPGSDLEKLLHMRDLIGLRLSQCRAQNANP